MSDDFATYVQNERDRLHAKNQAVNEQIENLKRQAAEIGREFAAIDAYERAKTGKSAPAAGTTRRSRGSRRQNIINVLGAKPLGMSRGELLEHMGLKGDKSGEMSVSNALTAMQRSGQITRQDNGRWAVVGAALQEAAE